MSKASNDPTIRLLRTEMAARGWAPEDVAKRASYDPAAFRVQLCKGIPSEHLRAVIEGRVFNFQLCLWSTAATLLLRNQCFDTFNIDPAAASLDELLALAHRLRIRLNKAQSKLTIAARRAVLDHLARNPSLLKSL